MSSWDERYQGERFLFGESPNISLKRLLSAWPSRGSALCVADGEGRNSVWLAEQGFEVTAFDLSKPASEKAQRLARKRGVNVEYRCCGIDDFAWGAEQFDVVVAVFIQFAKPERRDRLFQEMMASLKLGGALLLVGYTPEQLNYRTGGPGELEQLYTSELLLDAFKAQHVSHLRVCKEVLLEGEGHQGLSAFIEAMIERIN